MSERVQTPAPAASSSSRTIAARAPQLARKCACAAGEPHCSKCDDEAKVSMGVTMQRKASHDGAQHHIPPVVHSVLGSPGHTLDDGTRAFMESRFGYDFSQVRVHTGAQAAESARAVGAHAYTIGGDIVFDTGKYDPHSSTGRELLAHELTHAIQQSGVSSSASLDDVAITSPGDATEREADEVAQSVMKGTERGVRTASHGGAMMLARLAAPKPVSNPKALKRLKDAGIAQVENAAEMVDDGQTTTKRVLRRFQVAKLDLPKEKGPQRATQVFVDRAKAKALETIVSAAGNFRAVLKAARSNPGDLRKFWLNNVGVEEADATKMWNAGGGKTGDFLADGATTPSGARCQVDHIIELHIGGPDAPPNTQMLGGTFNNSSQAQIRGVIIGHASTVRDTFADAGVQVDEIAIRYKAVTQTAGTGDDECSLIEDKVRVAVAKKQKQQALLAGTEEYALKAGGFSQTLRVKKGKKDVTVIDASDLPDNAMAASLIAGMRLVELNRKKTKHFVVARLDSTNDKGRLPVTIKEETNSFDLSVENNELKLPPGDKQTQKIKFVYPYLSEGTITRLEFTDKGLHASGTIVPSIKLLAGLKFGVDITPESMSASLMPAEKLKSPIPGVHFGDPKLTFLLYPEFKPSGSINFWVGAENNSLMSGTLAIGVEGTDFFATSNVSAKIPGLNAATGTITYKKSAGWSGKVHLDATDKKFITAVSVDVSLSDKGVEAEGSITANPPGGSEITLKVRRDDQGRFFYKGKGKIRIHKLNEAQLDVEYGPATGFSITGKAPFTLFGKTADLTVFYKEGAFGGEMTNFPTFKKGKAEVTLEHLKYAKGKFSGAGSISLPLGDKFTAGGRVALDEQEQLSITAKLAIAKPILLFEPISGKREFFRINVSIPIPGASIGNLVGLQARITGAISAGYTIGPAILERAELAAGTNPLAEQSGTNVSFSGHLSMAASGFITGSLTGGVALSAFIAEVAGELTLDATGIIEGKSNIRTDLVYTPQRFTFHGELDASIKLGLLVTLTASVIARAGLTEWFSTETRKDWKLGEWPFPIGALGAKASFDYASDQPFKFPEIAFSDPAIDEKSLIETPMGRANATETKKG
jgi:Domain of unknown function (DUF4157)